MGEEYDLPEELADEEMARLGILMSEVPQPPLPRYAVGVMPPGLSPEEAYERALQESLEEAPPQMEPWAPAAAPPTAAPAYAPPDHRWPWEIPPYIVVDDDEEEH